ncbi:MAG TPA: 3-methyladenine DNA glycosylase [Legionellales bacterium]|nr:3-methyladenine DNA glycosylase [Legionellales bacterium]
MNKLQLDFFKRPTEIVAEELIGKIMMIHGKSCLVTETEAYKGDEDPASHAFKGPTERSAIMFGPCARLYIYLIYGMYHCMNIVAHEKGQAGAVLIRGLQLPNIHLNGPGKICKYFQIDRQLNHYDICQSDDIYIISHETPLEVIATPRIGIKKGHDKLWRFIQT